MGTLQKLKNAVGLASAAEKLQRAHDQIAELDRQEAEIASARAEREQALLRDLDTLLDDEDAHAAMFAELETHKAPDVRTRAKLKFIADRRDRAKKQLPSLQRAATAEKRDAVLSEAAKLVERIKTAATEEIVSARTTFERAKDARDALCVEAERLRMTARELSRELGDDLPSDLRWTVGQIANAAMLGANYRFRVGRLGKSQEQTQVDVINSEALVDLQRVYGLHEGLNLIPLHRYSLADRVRDLQKSPDVYGSRVLAIQAAERDTNEAARVEYERKRLLEQLTQQAERMRLDPRDPNYLMKSAKSCGLELAAEDAGLIPRGPDIRAAP